MTSYVYSDRMISKVPGILVSINYVNNTEKTKLIRIQNCSVCAPDLVVKPQWDDVHVQLLCRCVHSLPNLYSSGMERPDHWEMYNSYNVAVSPLLTCVSCEITRDRKRELMGNMRRTGSCWGPDRGLPTMAPPYYVYYF